MTTVSDGSQPWVVLLPVTVKGETGPGSGTFWISILGYAGLIAVDAAVLVRAELLPVNLAGAEPFKEGDKNDNV